MARLVARLGASARWRGGIGDGVDGVAADGRHRVTAGRCHRICRGGCLGVIEVVGRSGGRADRRTLAAPRGDRDHDDHHRQDPGGAPHHRELARISPERPVVDWHDVRCSGNELLIRRQVEHGRTTDDRRMARVGIGARRRGNPARHRDPRCRDHRNRGKRGARRRERSRLTAIVRARGDIELAARPRCDRGAPGDRRAKCCVDDLGARGALGDDLLHELLACRDVRLERLLHVLRNAIVLRSVSAGAQHLFELDAELLCRLVTPVGISFERAHHDRVKFGRDVAIHLGGRLDPHLEDLVHGLAIGSALE